MSRKHFAGPDRSKKLNSHSFPKRGIIQELSLTPKQFQPAWLIQVFIETGTVHNGHKHKPFQFRVKEARRALKWPFQQKTQAAMLPFCSPKTWLKSPPKQTIRAKKQTNTGNNTDAQLFCFKSTEELRDRREISFYVDSQAMLKNTFVIFRPFCFFVSFCFVFEEYKTDVQAQVRPLDAHCVLQVDSTLAEAHRCTSRRPQSTCETGKHRR